jgi:hypothetical protein
MLKGADHLKMYSDIKNKTKLVMSFRMPHNLSIYVRLEKLTCKRVRPCNC